MSRLVVGVIGHVDHGKTALVRALTGQETDRLPEEQARGISIALGFAHIEGRVDLIDMPGHERFVRTMISGATGIDAVLLVVAANEGVKPQTVEHAGIAGLLGISRALVAVSKCDLVSPEEAALVGVEAGELLARCGLASGPILTSATQCQGIAELRQALLALAERQEAYPSDGLAYLPIDRAFSVPGHGPVVTGTLRGAALAPGDTLELHPLRRPLRVRGVQVHGQSVAAAAPGQRVALNLRGAEIGELHRGMALAASDALAPSEWLTVWLRGLDGGPALKNGARFQALCGTSEGAARLRLLDRDVLEQGESCFAQLRFAEDVTVPAGEHVILRRQVTVAGGRVLEPVARRLRRRDATVLHRLEQLRALSPRELVAAEVAQAGTSGTTLRHLSRLTSLSPGRVIELLARLPVEITRAGAVVPREELERRKKLAPRPDPEREHADAELAEQIAEAMRAAGLTPPLPKALIADAASHRAVERLLRDGVLIRATDRDKGKELLFHRDAIDQARRVLAPLFGEGMLVGEIAAALGISRKFCMPLLDHLDTVRFTRRAGDRRLLH